MKTTKLEMGLVKLQAETRAESEALNGVLEMVFKFMPDAVCNNHGSDYKGMTYCVVPDGTVSETGDTLKPGIESRWKSWATLPWDYKFKRA